MKKITKKMSLPDIVDNVCEMEAYIEYLENRLDKHLSWSRNSDLTQLNMAKRRLKKLKSLL